MKSKRITRMKNRIKDMNMKRVSGIKRSFKKMKSVKRILNEY